MIYCYHHLFPLYFIQKAMPAIAMFNNFIPAAWGKYIRDIQKIRNVVDAHRRAPSATLPATTTAFSKARELSGRLLSPNRFSRRRPPPAYLAASPR